MLMCYLFLVLQKILLNGMKILQDLKILWETGSRRAKILRDFVSQCEVWHV